MGQHELILNTTSAPLSYHTGLDAGTILNRFSQELQLVDMDLTVAALGTGTSLSPQIPLID
jgi:hypothetical protein